MRTGVAGTHGIAARRGIPDGMCADGASVRRLSEIVKAQASGSTKGRT